MRRRFATLLLVLSAISARSFSADQKEPSQGHYLFAWTGDADGKGTDFLAVIDADPASGSYGHLVTTLATDQPTKSVHHTEYSMPASGMLFANDHEAGRTFIFDLHDPTHPQVAASFSDLDGYMHPHSYLRMPNGHVLASFQHAHHAGSGGASGALVEIDDHGKLVRSSSSADSSFPNALLTPYSLVILPDKDRVVATDSSMHLENIFSGVTYQVWRLSDLKLLKTSYFDVGENRYSQVGPQEPRLGPDGSVFVQTLSCGIERITDVDTNDPKAKLVYTFAGNWCGVPTIVGHFLIEGVRDAHGLVVLDITNGAKPVEVARLKLTDDYIPHWTAWDAKTQRLVVTAGLNTRGRLYLVKFDPATGALTMDETFRDTDGQVGFNFENRQWPHGWKGTGLPHAAVFSR
jgi:hypothetical protein